MMPTGRSALIPIMEFSSEHAACQLEQWFSSYAQICRRHSSNSMLEISSCRGDNLKVNPSKMVIASFPHRSNDLGTFLKLGIKGECVSTFSTSRKSGGYPGQQVDVECVARK